MARNSDDTHWHSNRHIVETVAAGILLGIAPILLKIASAAFYVSIYLVLGGAISIAGFYLMQKSLYRGRISLVVAVVAALSIITTFALTIFFFGEPVSYFKWAGAIAIMAGIAVLTKGGKGKQ